MAGKWHGFCHAISNLVCRGYISNVYETFKHSVPDEMYIDFDVFGAGMEDRILCKRQSTLIVTP
ncbi:hypothetical protein Scep_023010 [Stephania cephalantha]|uniref:Uncharacterized protein n=1 Tax=Stephania cephalantha TaxID=152367 RepID=A0AAP0F7H5_9MAGN